MLKPTREYVDHIRRSRCDPLLKFITAEIAGTSAAEAYFRTSSAISMLEEVRDLLKQRALIQAVEIG
jgi:predicted alpha/beta-fold hydrolase